MEIELNPTISLLEETFNVLVAPEEMLVDAINSHLNLQRYKVLFVSGNYSRILSKLNRNITELDVRRAFTSFQHDHTGGEPPQFPDRGARPPAL